MGIAKVDYTKLEPNACQRGVTCPIEKGQIYNYTESMYIGSYPPVNLF